MGDRRRAPPKPATVGAGPPGASGKPLGSIGDRRRLPDILPAVGWRPPGAPGKPPAIDGGPPEGFAEVRGSGSATAGGFREASGGQQEHGLAPAATVLAGDGEQGAGLERFSIGSGTARSAGPRSRRKFRAKNAKNAKARTLSLRSSRPWREIPFHRIKRPGAPR
jgi:hypothetical protein